MDDLTDKSSQLSNQQVRHRRKGSDPLLSTARGKLQCKRSKVNDQINRELRMRNGAENLFRATGNKKLKELVAVELSFFNSNIQLLKEELANLNSSIELYQYDSDGKYTPMIPLGLKETKDVDFKLPIKDFILEHYSENEEEFERELSELADLRQAVRTPLRNLHGIELLLEYYNQLQFLEKRFFPPDRNTGIFFHWYDSFTGIPSTQRTVGFEKGCILFNTGAVYSQIACKQNRHAIDGLTDAVSNFQLAAGSFHYLHSHFSHAPSMDMQPKTLAVLVQLMLAQAQECVYECQILSVVPDSIRIFVNLAQEAAMVSQAYGDCFKLMDSEVVKEFIPFSWISIAQAKTEYYKGLSYSHIAKGLLQVAGKENPEEMEELFHNLYRDFIAHAEDIVIPPIPVSEFDRRLLGKSFLKEAILCHEEALHIHEMCKQHRKIDSFLEFLEQAHDRSIEVFSSMEEEDDFTELPRVPPIPAVTILHTSPLLPEFMKYKVTDIFHKLGPITIFNAKNQWSAPRCLKLQRTPDCGFGFSVRGDCPVIIADIEKGSVAEVVGVHIADFVIGVGQHDTKWSRHDEVVRLIRQAGNNLMLKLVSPMWKSTETSPVQKPSDSPVSQDRMQSPESSLSSNSSKSNRSRFSAPWIFVRKGSKEKSDKTRKSYDDSDIIFKQ